MASTNDSRDTYDSEGSEKKGPVESNAKVVLHDSETKMNERLDRLKGLRDCSKDDAQIYSEFLDSLDKKSEETINALEQSIDAVNLGAQKTLDDYKFYVNVVLLLAIAALALSAVLSWLNLYSVGVAIILVAITTVTAWLLLKISLSKLKKNVEKAHSNGLVKKGEFTTFRVELQTTKKTLLAKLVSLSKRGFDIHSTMNAFYVAAKNHVPLMEDYMEIVEKQSNIDIFKNTLNNAAYRYGFDAAQWIEDCLPFTLFESEPTDAWIVKSANHLSSKFRVSPDIIVLSYYDYIQDPEGANNSWERIKKSKDGVTELTRSLLKNGVVESRLIDTTVGELGAIEKLVLAENPFNLESFKQKYNTFYFDHLNEKRSIIAALEEYQVGTDSRNREHILKHSPKEADSESRLKELIQFTSGQFSIPVEIVSFIYYDRDGNTVSRRRFWSTIRLNSELLESFSRLLLDGNLIEVPTHYWGSGKEHDIIAYVANTLKNRDDLSLQDAFRYLHDRFSLLEMEKNRFISALAPYDVLSMEEAANFKVWLPTGLGNCNKEIATELSDKLHLPPDALMLLYYDHVQDYVSRREKLECLRAINGTRELAKLVLRRRSFKLNLLDANEISQRCLEFIIRNEEDYDLVRLQSTLVNFIQQYEDSKNLAAFMADEGLFVSGSEVDFESLLTSFLGRMEKNRNESMVDTAESLLMKYASDDFSEGPWRQSVCLACVVLYTFKTQNYTHIDSCKRAAMDDRSTRILYSTSDIREKEEQRAEPRLSSLFDIIQIIKDFDDSNYPHIINFKHALVTGMYYPKIQQLVSATLRDIQKQVNGLREDGQLRLEKTIKSNDQAVKDFLDSELDFDIVLQTLNMQLVNAYMLTAKGKSPVISMIDTTLPEACLRLGEQDPIFKNLLIMAKDSEKTAGGKSTRLGIVPFGMSFDQFKDYFQLAIQEATDHYKTSGDTDESRLADFSANLVRIFPSDSFFRRIDLRGGDSSSIDHPVNIVRNLVIDNYEPMQSLEILATMRGKDEKTVALRRVIITLIDTRSSIQHISGEKLTDVLKGSNLVDALEKKEFDQELIDAFHKHTLSELALNVYRESEQDKPLFQNRFIQIVNGIIRSRRVHLGEERKNECCDIILKALYELGLVLDDLIKSEKRAR